MTGALRHVPLDEIFARVRSTEPAALLARLRHGGLAGTFGLRGGGNLLCLLETALLDLLGRRLGLGGAELVPTEGAPAARRPALPVSQVLDLSLDVEEFLDTRGPFHFVKVKAADDIDRDLRTVTAIRARLGDTVPVMVDANMSWTPDEAHGTWPRCATPAATRRKSWPRGPGRNSPDCGPAPVFASCSTKSVCTLDDARTAVESGACDAFNVRVAKNGGPVTAARVIELARRAGLGFQVGVQVAEVGPLINAGRALAFAHGDAFTVEAGQSDRFFPEPVVSPPPAVCRTTNTITPAPWARLRPRPQRTRRTLGRAAPHRGRHVLRPLPAPAPQTKEHA